MADDAQDWRVSCHEAGHAIVLVGLGLAIRLVRTGADAVTEWVDDPFDPARTQQEILACLTAHAAGAAAEEIVFGKVIAPGLRRDCASYRQLRWHLPEAGGQDWLQQWKVDVARARAILEVQPLRAIARELHARGELTHLEVAAMMTPPLDADPPNAHHGRQQ